MKISYSNQGFGFNQVFLTSPSYGLPAGQLSNGIPYSPAALTATNFDPGAYPNVGQLNSPPNFIVPNNGRPPRFVQTTVGIEREIANNLSVNASFIDNRGVWLEFRRADEYYKRTHSVDPLNEIRFERYQSDRLQPADAADLFCRRGGKRLHSSVRHLPVGSHPGSGITAVPAIRWHWRLLRARWQLVVRRASNQGHQAAQQRICRAASVTPGRRIWEQSPALELIPRRCRFRIHPSRPRAQKSYVAIDQPQMLNFYFNYEVPRFSFSQNGWKRAVLTGWTTDGIFHYQSGFPMQTPNSTSTLTSVTFRQWSLGESCSGPEALPAQPQRPQREPSHHVLPQPRRVGKPGRPEPTRPPSRTTGITAARDIPANSWALARSSR